MKTIQRHILLLLLFWLGIGAKAQVNQAYWQYINQYKDVAVEQMLRYGIPASITMAQGLLESRAGLSRLARQGNNHFGIKCHGWTGRTISEDDDAYGECFRAYDSALQSYEDHSRFLRDNQRYRRLFSLRPNDYEGWARGLKACGYATNPAYADNLISIINRYRLYELDRYRTYDRFMVRHSGDKPQSALGLHPITICNKNYYLVARQGDTFKSIAKEVGISYRKLAKYNERDKHDVLRPGDIIFLKKKRSKADRSFKHRPHVVKAGESMYSISQLYGIKLKSLYKKNHLAPDHQIRVGEVLKVY